MGRSISDSRPTFAGAALQRFAQTCKQRQTYLLTQSRDGNVSSKSIACNPLFSRIYCSTFTNVLQLVQVITVIPVVPNAAPREGFRQPAWSRWHLICRAMSARRLLTHNELPSCSLDIVRDRASGCLLSFFLRRNVQSCPFNSDRHSVGDHGFHHIWSKRHAELAIVEC